MSKLAVYSEIIDRSLDRWENAIEEARAASYTSEQFVQDVATSWNDWALFAALPLTIFGLDVSVKPAIPTVEFIVTDKTVKPTVVVHVPPIDNVTGASPESLYRLGTTAAPFIQAKYVIATLAGTEYLYVTLDSPGIVTSGGVTANVYRGNIIGTPAKAIIARVTVVWPG